MSIERGRAARVELRRQGTQVIGVHVGFVDTGRHRPNRTARGREDPAGDRGRLRTRRAAGG
ncbi:MAG TPA: hypothetical protein VI055_16930 [Rubrobacter sp.]